MQNSFNTVSYEFLQQTYDRSLKSMKILLFVFFSCVDSEEEATQLQSPFFGKLEKGNLSCLFLIQNEKEMELLYMPESMLWTAM